MEPNKQQPEQNISGNELSPSLASDDTESHAHHGRSNVDENSTAPIEQPPHQNMNGNQLSSSSALESHVSNETPSTERCNSMYMRRRKRIQSKFCFPGAHYGKALLIQNLLWVLILNVFPKCFSISATRYSVQRKKMMKSFGLQNCVITIRKHAETERKCRALFCITKLNEPKRIVERRNTATNVVDTSGRITVRRATVAQDRDIEAPECQIAEKNYQMMPLGPLNKRTNVTHSGTRHDEMSGKQIFLNTSNACSPMDLSIANRENVPRSVPGLIPVNFVTIRRPIDPRQLPNTLRPISAAPLPMDCTVRSNNVRPMPNVPRPLAAATLPINEIGHNIQPSMEFGDRQPPNFDRMPNLALDPMGFVEYHRRLLFQTLSRNEEHQFSKVFFSYLELYN